jgi:NAD(P)-dependent dehydrogenase (short-subunit alcohol dehydrogenase family)
MNIDGKVIVITGAARGIGQEYARYLGGLGARIVAADINDCSGTLDLVKTEKGTAVGAKLDVASAASAMDVARAAVDAFGRIDALINNAALYGGLKGGRFDTISEPDWDAAMAVNVKGIWNCCKAVVPAIRRAGGGSIVNIASPTGFDKGAGYTAYATSKGGLSTLTRVVALDYAGHKVRCNAIVPGATETPLIASLLDDPDVRARLERLSPLGRLGQPQDLVPLAIYLASDESAFSTGAHFFADGGAVLH